VEARVLLDMRQLLKSTITVGALVRLLSSVHPDMLHELVVTGKALHALLALVRLGIRARRDIAAQVSCAGHAVGSKADSGNLLLYLLHRAFVHKKLQVQTTR